jgi:hypothetical protein
MGHDAGTAQRQGRLPALPGLLRIVRGRLTVKATHVAALGRASVTASFLCDWLGGDDPLPLHETHLVHADEMRLVLSGYECIEDIGHKVHYGQTWVLVPCEGSEPEAPRGPAFPG